MKITKKDDTKIVVEAKVKRRKLASDPYMSLGVEDVISFLEKEGIKATGDWVCQRPLVISNYAANTPTSGEFVFLKNKSLTPELKNDTVEVVQEEENSDTETVEEIVEKPVVTGRRRRRSRASRAKEENKLLGTETLE